MQCLFCSKGETCAWLTTRISCLHVPELNLVFLLEIGAGKKRNVTLSQPENAVCALNELRPGLSYKTVSVSGPINNPRFKVSGEVCYKFFTNGL
jgi:hypothetical protein